MIESLRTQLTNLNGPVPTGFADKPSSSASNAVGEAIAKGDIAKFFKNGA